MLELNLLTFLSFLAFVNAASPSGCIPGIKDKTICFTFQINNTPFANAEEFCINAGGHLASIHNMVDNMLITQQAGNRFTDSDSSDFWIGANDFDTQGTWAWMDETKFNYSNWEAGEPKNSSGTDCGSIKMPSGKWIADDCYIKTKPFICSIQISSASNFTGYCYKVFDNSTWLNAEEWCKVNKAHLASIHSHDEDILLANFANYPGADVCQAYPQAWIGLYSDYSVNWQWTDGTPLDYINWFPGNPYNYGNSAATYLHIAPICGHKEGYWADNSNQLFLAKFICQRAPS